MGIPTPAVRRFSKENSEAPKYATSGKQRGDSARTLNSTTPCLTRIAPGTDRAGSAVAPRALPHHADDGPLRVRLGRLRWRRRERLDESVRYRIADKAKGQASNLGLSFCL
jgi:hypothetical protein